MALTPQGNAAELQTHVLVLDVPHVSDAGSHVGVKVRLVAVRPHLRSIPVEGRVLYVTGNVIAGGRTQAFLRPRQVITDADGFATIRLTVPHRVRNQRGQAISTSVRLTVNFAGEEPKLAAGRQNAAIIITIR